MMTVQHQDAAQSGLRLKALVFVVMVTVDTERPLFGRVCDIVCYTSTVLIDVVGSTSFHIIMHFLYAVMVTFLP
jgi:hypothetical protein